MGFSILKISWQGKKGVWLKLPLERSELVPVAVKVQFLFGNCSYLGQGLFESLGIICCVARLPANLLFVRATDKTEQLKLSKHMNFHLYAKPVACTQFPMIQRGLQLLLILLSDLSFVKPSTRIPNCSFVFSFLYLCFHQKSIFTCSLSLVPDVEL